MSHQQDVFYDKSVTCIYCTTTFKTKRVRIGKIKPLRRDSDFCTYFEGENPILYEYNICPHCGLAFTDSFAPIRGPKRDLIKSNYLDKLEKIPNACGPRTLEDALKGYKLTLLCATILNEKHYIQANLCLRIAWLYRYLERKEEEKRFLQNAVELYETMYQTEKLDNIPMEEPKLLYLIAEIHARLGHYDLTRKWFSYLLTARHIEEKWKKTARNRWFEIKTQHAQIEDPEGYEPTKS
jgi:uncharacterized protein (DUF2225 family)